MTSQTRLIAIELRTFARTGAGSRESRPRLLLGVGGSAGNCGHAVNDFRKICGIECYAPTDNVSELTARTNDEGFEHIFSAWLKTSRLGPKDAIFIFSVGGGNSEKNPRRPNLVHAIEFAKERAQLSRSRRKRRRTYRQVFLKRCDHPDCECGPHHSYHRSLSGSGVAFACYASSFEVQRDKVGVHKIERRTVLPGPRRNHKPSRRAERVAVSACLGE